MDQLDKLQSAAASLLSKAENGTITELASAVEKATGVLRLLGDLDKSRAEKEKIELEQSTLKYEREAAARRERTDRHKDYVSMMAPFLTIITLAATLVWQSWQFMRSEDNKKDAVEDAQWDEAIKTISQTNNPSASLIVLKQFLNRPRHHGVAKDAALRLLVTNNDPLFFDDMFGAAFVPVSWNNLDDVLALDRALAARDLPLAFKSFDPKTDKNDQGKLNDREKEMYKYTEYVVPLLSQQVGSVMKSPRLSGSIPNLSATEFETCDWIGADLRGANIQGMRLTWADLKDANLDRITQFEGVYFYHVAWWEASRISPELLKYLETNDVSRYNPTSKYGRRGQTVTREEYVAALERLKR